MGRNVRQSRSERRRDPMASRACITADMFPRSAPQYEVSSTLGMLYYCSEAFTDFLRFAMAVAETDTVEDLKVNGLLLRFPHIAASFSEDGRHLGTLGPHLLADNGTRRADQAARPNKGKAADGRDRPRYSEVTRTGRKRILCCRCVVQPGDCSYAAANGLMPRPRRYAHRQGATGPAGCGPPGYCGAGTSLVHLA